MPQNDYLQSLRAAFKSIYRVLSPREGTFVHISHGSPIMRVPYLRSEGWAVAACPLLEGEDLFVYTLVRTDNEELLNSQVSTYQSINQSRVAFLPEYACPRCSAARPRMSGWRRVLCLNQTQASKISSPLYESRDRAAASRSLQTTNSSRILLTR